MKLSSALALVVVTAALAAGCGGERVRAAPCSTPPRGSTVELTYRVSGGDAGTTAGRLCRRLLAFESARFEVGRLGTDRIRVVGSGAAASRAAVDAALEGSSLRIYDWEPNVLGHRGPAAPFAGASARSGARALASRAESSSKPVAIVEDRRLPGQPPQLRRYFVIRDDPALTRADITNPRAVKDEITGQPTVSFDFTAPGRREFKRLTERVAARGAEAAAADGPSEDSFQHFAIVVDERIVSLPAVDSELNPRGIDAPSAQIAGAGSLEETRLQARRLAAAPLDADLELVSVR